MKIGSNGKAPVENGIRYLGDLFESQQRTVNNWDAHPERNMKFWDWRLTA